LDCKVEEIMEYRVDIAENDKAQEEKDS